MVRKWMRAAGVEAKAPEEAISRESPAPSSPARSSRAKPTPAGGRYRVDVAAMAQPDRERAVLAVRNIAEIVEIGTTVALNNLRRAVKLLESGGERSDEDQILMGRLLSLDKENAQAMLHLSRTQGLIIDTHPGLMKLAGVEDTTKDGRRNLAKVAEAFGLKGPDG